MHKPYTGQTIRLYEEEIYHDEGDTVMQGDTVYYLLDEAALRYLCETILPWAFIICGWIVTFLVVADILQLVVTGDGNFIHIR